MNTTFLNCTKGLMLLLLALTVAWLVSAAPVGTTVTSNITGSRTAIDPTLRSEAGGTITTMDVSAIQQNPNWKAYVGNLSAVLSLDDSNNKTIFEWPLLTLTGEIYAARLDSINFSLINCSDISNISAEEAAMGFSSTDLDTINKTFNQTGHNWFVTGINNMTGCKSTATFVNDSVQADLPAADFQEVVAGDGTNLIYVSLLESDVMGYDNETTYDFQVLLPQNKSTLDATGYYFWIEIG